MKIKALQTQFSEKSRVDVKYNENKITFLTSLKIYLFVLLQFYLIYLFFKKFILETIKCHKLMFKYSSVCKTISSHV